MTLLEAKRAFRYLLWCPEARKDFSSVQRVIEAIHSFQKASLNKQIFAFVFRYLESSLFVSTLQFCA